MILDSVKLTTDNYLSQLSFQLIFAKLTGNYSDSMLGNSGYITSTSPLTIRVQFDDQAGQVDAPILPDHGMSVVPVATQ